MKNKTNQTIRDGLVVTVVGGLILAGLTYLVQRYYKLFFDWLGLITDSVKQYLQSTTTISFWIIWLVILLLLALIIFTIKNTKSKKSSKILLPESYIQQLQQEISRLKAQDAPMLADLAGIDDEVTISGKYLSTSHGRREMSRTLSWKEVFSSIAPYLLENPNDYKMKATVAPKALFPRYQSATINDQDYETIKIHLMALKLTTVNYIPTTTGGMALFWSLTPKGHALLMEFRSVKKTQKPN